MNTITPQSLSLLDASGKTLNESSNKLIPAGGSLQATVRQVSQDQLSPNVFRLKLEANSLLMELKTQQPIAQGSQVTLSRSNNGQLSVTVAAPNTIKTAITTTGNTTNESQTNRTYQATVTPVIRSANDLPQLNRLIPQGKTVIAQVNAQINTQPQTISSPSGLTQGLSPQAATSLQASIPSQTQAQTTNPSQNTVPLPSIPSNTTPPANTHSQAQSGTITSQVQQPATQPNPLLTQSTREYTQAPLPSTNQTAQPAGTSQIPLISGQLTPNTQIPRSPILATPFLQPQSTQSKYSSDSSPHLLRLSVKGETITLKTTANLPPLQQVQISRSTNDQFIIRWNQPISSPPTTSVSPMTTAQTQTIENSMRELLPQQITITSGVQQLINSTHLSTASAAGQIDKIVQSLMQLFGVQPGAAEAQQAIKQNINYGGLFTENKLANNQPPSKDIKKFLGKMQALAEQLPTVQKQMVQTTIDKMLARVTTNQLTSLQQRQEKIESNERFFQVDLPVQNQNSLENVELRISQRTQKNNRNEPETIWKVRLHFDLEDAGSIDAELSLNQEQNELSASFTCTKDDTVSSVRDQLERFKTQLTALGLKVPALVCKQGNQCSPQTAIQKQLIDIKT